MSRPGCRELKDVSMPVMWWVVLSCVVLSCVLCCVELCCVGWCGMGECDVMLWDVVVLMSHSGVTWGVVWCGIIKCNEVWWGMMWCDEVWCDVTDRDWKQLGVCLLIECSHDWIYDGIYEGIEFTAKSVNHSAQYRRLSFDFSAVNRRSCIYFSTGI